ncbi:MAG: MASE1 domain-containing protein [Rubrivivax sp.]|nr:MASE1 domain-containing protein [Rubrivivax sp.]
MHADPAPVRWPRRPPGLDAALVFGCGFLLSWAAIAVARLPGTVAVIWLANGAVIALVASAPRERTLALLATAAAANLAGNVAYGDTVRLSLAFLPPNVLEVAAGVWLVRRTGLAERFLEHQGSFLRVIAAGVFVPPLLGATVGAATLQALGFAPFARVWPDWYIGDAIGALATLPLVLALRGGDAAATLRRLAAPAGLAVLGAVALAVVAAVQWLHHPFAAIGVVLVAVAFVRPRVEAFAGVTVTVVVLALLLATGRLSVVDSPQAHLQLFLGVLLVLLPPLVVAVAVARQRTLSRTLAAVGSRVDDIVVVSDRDGVLLWANEAREIYWGVPNASVIGRNGRDVTPAAYWNEVLGPIVARAAAGETVRRRAEIDFPARGRRTMELTVQPAHDEEGQRVGVLFCSTDVTEVEASRRELQRTADALRASHNDLEQFVRIASHDLREPLNTIQQFCSLIEQRHAAALDDEGRLYFEQVRGGAARLREMLDDVLQYVRLEQAAPPAPREVDLDAVLHEVLAALQAIAAGSGATVQAGPLGTVPGHRALLAVLLQNLVANALKFVPPGRAPQVRVAARREGGTLRLEVHDNGIGIDAARVGELGTPFHRLHARRKYPGTGLGLAICRRIAEQHGGTIEITSRAGEGSCFALVMPEAGPPETAVAGGAPGARDVPRRARCARRARRRCRARRLLAERGTGPAWPRPGAASAAPCRRRRGSSARRSSSPCAWPGRSRRRSRRG